MKIFISITDQYFYAFQWFWNERNIFKCIYNRSTWLNSKLPWWHHSSFFFRFVGKTNFWHCLFCSGRLQILYMIFPLWWGKKNSTLFKTHPTMAGRAKMLQFTNIRKCCWSKLAALGVAGSTVGKGRSPSNLQPHLSHVQSQNPFKSLLLKLQLSWIIKSKLLVFEHHRFELWNFERHYYMHSI